VTSREVVVANIECRAAGRIGMRYRVEGRMDDFASIGCKAPLPDRRRTEGEMEYYADLWGNTWRRIRGMSKKGEIFAPALADWSDLDALELPDLGDPAWYADARDLAAREKEKFRLGNMPGWPFATCRYMRSMEQYFMDLAAERERIDILHDRVTALLEQVIDRYGQAGMDGIMFSEDLGVQDRTLFSPAMFRDIFRPLYERLTGRAHGYGMKVIQHSCGFNWALIDDLCEAGIDCLQFDQPGIYDMPELAKKLRKHGVGLYSPCDIQKVLPTGDKALIERETERLVRAFRGGFIATNYADLHGIGVKPEWDQWAYDTFVRVGVEEFEAADSTNHR
jgi:hypothetical protein